MPCIPGVLHSTSVVFPVSLDSCFDVFLHLLDVLDMVDVLIEDSDGFDEEVGFSLNEDVIISLQCCCPCCIRSQE